MDTLLTTLSGLDVGFALLFLGSLIALLNKALRRKAGWTALIAFVCFVAVGFATVPFSKQVARDAGYPDARAKLEADKETRARDRADEQARDKAIQQAKQAVKEQEDGASGERTPEADDQKAALVKVMKDVVAARHGGVLPKTMSEEDIATATQAAAKWKAEQAVKMTKLGLGAMKTKPLPRSGDAEILLAKESIAKILRDPSSAIFGDAFFVNDRKSSTGYYV